MRGGPVSPKADFGVRAPIPCRFYCCFRYVEYCLNRLKLLRMYRIRPIMVFDGGPLPMKAYREEERANRRLESRQRAQEFLNQMDGQTATGRRAISNLAVAQMSKSADVTPEMAFVLIEALKREGFDFIVAPYEADAQMAYLDRIGQVSAIISEDSDLLLFGCRRILFKLDKQGNADEICLDRLGGCEEMDLREFSLKRFRQMCIVSGCDYLPPLGGLGIKSLHKIFLKHRTIDRVLPAIRRECNKLIPPEYEAEMVKAELTFMHQRVFCPRLRCLVHLNPLPRQFEFELNVNIGQDLDFLGPDLEVGLAQGIADGLVNPITKSPFTVSREKSRPTVEPARHFNNLPAANTARLTIKRAISTEAVTDVQATLRERFSKPSSSSTSLMASSIPKYALLSRPQISKVRRQKPAVTSDPKQFSILNFCVPRQPSDAPKAE